ncbi:hypothetical protein EON79_09430, partial [bacterium]
MRKTTTLSAFALVALASAQSPLWTQVEGAPAWRLRDASTGVSLRWELGSTQARLYDLTTQLGGKTVAQNAIGVYDATIDGTLFALGRVADNGDGTESYYVDVNDSNGVNRSTVMTHQAVPGEPFYGPNRVFFTPGNKHLVLQYWADAEGNLNYAATYIRLVDGQTRTNGGRFFSLPEGNKGLLVKADGTFRILDLDSGIEGAFPTALPTDFSPREAQGDWILGSVGSTWIAVRRSDGFQRTIALTSNESVLGIAWAGKVAVVSNHSTGGLRYVALSNGVIRSLPSTVPGQTSLSPDRSRIVLPLVNGRKGLLRVSDGDMKVSDERSWTAGFDSSSRAWMVSPSERRVRTDSGSIVDSTSLPARPGTSIWTDGTIGVDRVFENSKEAYYKVTLATGARTKWFEVVPQTGAWVDVHNHQLAMRHHRLSGNPWVSVYDSSGAETYANFSHGTDYLAVQKFLPNSLPYGTYTEGPPNVSGNCYFAIYDPYSGRKVKRISLGTTRDIAQATVNSTGSMALVPTIFDGRLVDLVAGKARRLNGQAAKTWQESTDAGAGHPSSAISGDGTVLFLSSG